MQAIPVYITVALPTVSKLYFSLRKLFGHFFYRLPVFASH